MNNDYSTDKIPQTEDILNKYDKDMYTKGYIYKLILQPPNNNIDPIYAKTIADIVDVMLYIKDYTFKIIDMSKILKSR